MVEYQQQYLYPRNKKIAEASVEILIFHMVLR